MWPALTIVLPAFDEEDALPPTVERVRRFFAEHVADPELIIVDDGSRDGTPALVDRLAAAHPEVVGLHLDRNRGMGAALQAGYAAAAKPWVTMLPGDGQIDPYSLLDFFACIERTDADLVTSVYRNRAYDPYRKALSVGLRVLTAAIVGTRARTEGTYVVRRTVLRDLGARSDSFMLTLEIPIRARRFGYRVETIAIDVHPRVAGRSKATSVGRIAATFRELIALRIELERERLRR